VPAKIEPSRSGKPSLARRGVAALVLAVAAVLVFEFVAHILTAIILVIVIVAVIGAVLWAANQLL
jgi:Flp pilus assembly protein TadB